MKEELSEKFVSKAGDFKPITNEDMVCKGCYHMLKLRSDLCGQFPNVKPTSVIRGGDCPKFRRV